MITHDGLIKLGFILHEKQAHGFHTYYLTYYQVSERYRYRIIVHSFLQQVTVLGCAVFENKNSDLIEYFGIETFNNLKEFVEYCSGNKFV